MNPSYQPQFEIAPPLKILFSSFQFWGGNACSHIPQFQSPLQRYICACKESNSQSEKLDMLVESGKSQQKFRRPPCEGKLWVYAESWHWLLNLTKIIHQWSRHARIVLQRNLQLVNQNWQYKPHRTNQNPCSWANRFLKILWSAGKRYSSYPLPLVLRSCSRVITGSACLACVQTSPIYFLCEVEEIGRGTSARRLRLLLLVAILSH